MSDLQAYFPNNALQSVADDLVNVRSWDDFARRFLLGTGKAKNTNTTYLCACKQFYEFTGDWRYFYTLCAVIILMALSFAVNIKRSSLFHLSLAAAFSFAALGSFRFGIFLILTGAVFIGYNLSSWVAHPMTRRNSADSPN